MSRNAAIGLVVALLVLCCLCLFLVLSGAGFVTYRFLTSTEFAPLWTQVFASPTPTPAPLIVLTPVPSPIAGATDTLNALQQATLPQADLRELAMRLKGVPDIPVTVSDTPTDYAVGDKLDFEAGDDATQTYFTVTAALIYKTQNVYFFAQDGLEVNRDDVQKLLDTFQDKIYPTDREFFGPEWNPGVDGDPRLYILYARGLGSNVAGYYRSADEYSRLAHPDSNEKEMFYVNADGVSVGDDYLYSTLAHEFQHMIHWYHDRNEESWMNEGASELAAFINGYSVGGADWIFARDPDLQLTAWSSSASPDFGPHYGAAFLFMAYFLDRFGEQATQALVADPANGLQAVDHTLTTLNLMDEVTGAPLTADDVFADWAVANYLLDPSVADGRYAYHNYADAPRVSGPTGAFYDCPVTPQATVHQFAADYYEINCGGSFTLGFSGSLQVPAIPAQVHGGRYAFWSNRGDDSDMTLTRAFDLTGVKSATLKYWMWAQIELNFDYVYLEVSQDGGKTWQIVRAPSTTATNPTGANLGWGYTGNSGGGDPERGDPAPWIEESVDLSPYAGKKIQIRFEYVTDAALNYAGLMLDDISIPEIGYVTGFEADDGGWEHAGFVRMDNILPQRFIVQVIRQGVATTVERMSLDENNTGSLPLNLQRGEKAVVVISGATPFTTEIASYQFEIK